MVAIKGFKLVSEYLLIHLQANGRADWLNCDAEGRLYEKPQSGLLSDIPKQSPNCHVIVLLPSVHASLYEVSLPASSYKQQLKALPYALEEQLPGDLEDYFFAVCQKSTDSKPLGVVVIKHQFLREHIHRLEEVGITPHVMLPELLAFQYTPSNDVVQVHVDSHHALIRTDLFKGAVVDLVHLDDILKREFLSQKIMLSGPGAGKIHLSVEVERQEKTLPILAQAIKTSLNNPPVNLLRQEYQTSRPRVKQTNRWFYRWKTSVFLLLALFFVCLFGKSLYLMHTYRLYRVQEAKISQIYYANFPEGQAAVSPRNEIAQKLAQLRRAASGGAFLRLLDKTASVFAQYPALKFQSIHYKNGQLDIIFPLINLQWQKAMLNKLREQGLMLHYSYDNHLLTFHIKEAD